MDLKSRDHPIEGPMLVRLGECLQKRREVLSMTQRELGGRIGIGYQQIGRYETTENMFTVARFWRMAKALEMEPASLAAIAFTIERREDRVRALMRYDSIELDVMSLVTKLTNVNDKEDVRDFVLTKLRPR
ncbi:MAG: helix-turn-helix transcriptional regulator [Pseudomonadota bacterium]